MGGGVPEEKALVPFGVKLKDWSAPFTEILKKSFQSLRDYYIEHLQGFVEDKDCHIEKPPKSI